MLALYLTHEREYVCPDELGTDIRTKKIFSQTAKKLAKKLAKNWRKIGVFERPVL
jgi:hypothetical protein